jgi:hypothetical protein
MVDRAPLAKNGAMDLTKFMLDNKEYFGQQSEISKIEEDSIQVS